MKTKNKIVAIVEIAIVLCSVFLVALPGIAAEQNAQKVGTSKVTVTGVFDKVYRPWWPLGVYGNANEDDTIDMGDVVYTKLAIFGKKPETKLCDAKYDGRINVLDVIQTKLIILGRESELTIIDTLIQNVTFKKPVKTIVIGSTGILEVVRSLGVQKEMVVGVPSERMMDPSFFPEFVDVLAIGSPPDIEAILNINPDAVFFFVGANMNPYQDKLELAGISVARFRCAEKCLLPEEAKKLGYIFDKEEETEEYLDWRENILNSINETVEEIPEEDKPKVYIEAGRPYFCYSAYGYFGYIAEAGGKDIFIESTLGNVDPEAVIQRNPDIIVKVASCTAGGYGVDADDTTELEKIRDEIMNRPELQEVKAVKSEKVYVITNHLTPWGPCTGNREYIQIAYQAKWFHPELFEDLDPKEIHQEYLTRFQGLDIDLDKKGVFVYPEPS